MTWVGPDPWQAPDPSVRRAEFLPPGAPRAGGLDRDRVAAWVVDIGKVATPLVLLGAPAGLLWVRLSPRIDVDNGAGGPSFPSAETQEALSVDLSYLLLTLLAGLACGVLVWQWRRRDGSSVPVGLALGTALAAMVARAVGERVVLDDLVAKICETRISLGCTYYSGHAHLRATGLLVAWPISALMAYLLLTAILDRETAPPASVDWGYYAAPEPYRPPA
jgi:hypothetical protein